MASRHIANLYFLRKEVLKDALDRPLWQAYRVTCDALEAAQPTARTGLIAKARAAEHEAWDADCGIEVPEACKASAWVWDLVNDLLLPASAGV